MGKGNKKRGYTKIETDWFGNKYVQRYNESGKKIGYIKKETDLLGKRIAQHYTQDGKKKGYSTKERDLLANPYRQFYSKNHGKTGYSKKTENLLGHKRTEHYSEQYKKRGYSKKEEGWFGDKYYQNYGEVDDKMRRERVGKVGNCSSSSYDSAHNFNPGSGIGIGGPLFIVVIIFGFAYFISTLSFVWQMLLLSGAVIGGTPLTILVWRAYHEGLKERAKIEKERQDRERERFQWEHDQFLRKRERDRNNETEANQQVEKLKAEVEYKRYAQIRQKVKEEGVSAFEVILSADISDLKIANEFADKISESHDRGHFPGSQERQIILDNIKAEVKHREETREYLEDFHDRKVSDEELDRWISMMSGNVTKIRTVSISINGETMSKSYINGEEGDLSEDEIFEDVLSSSYDENG